MSKNMDNIYIRLNKDNERERRISDFLALKNANKFLFMEAMDLYMKMYEQIFTNEISAALDDSKPPTTGTNFLKGNKFQ